jgi:small subunit ribosomal protein S13
LVNTDLDGKKNVGTALAYVPGVGKRLAFVVAREANVDPTVLIGNLKDPEIAAVNKAIEELTETLPTWMLNRRKDPESGDDRHMIGTEITIMLREDLRRRRPAQDRGRRRRPPGRHQRPRRCRRRQGALGRRRRRRQDRGQAGRPRRRQEVDGPAQVPAQAPRHPQPPVAG